MPNCSSCCYEGLTAVPDLNDFCICSSPVGSTFVGTTGRVFTRITTSIPCTLNDWVEMITPASNSFDITDGSFTDTIVLGDTLLFTSPNNSVAIQVTNNTVSFALSPSIIPVNPIPGCIASNSLQGALVEICNHITGLTVTAANVTVQDALGCYAGSNVEAVLAEICNTLQNMPAVNVKLVDSGGYYVSNHAEGAFAEIGAKLVALPATNVAVADIGNCYAATNLEAVLAEICTKFNAISANDISVPDPGGYFVSSVLTTVLQEIGAELNALPASQVTIIDAGGCYASSTVEGALQELCTSLNSLLAVDVAITDAGNYYIGTSVEAALQEVGAKLAALPAANVTVADVGGYYAGTNVEAVLQEIGADLASVPAPVTYNDTTSIDLTFLANVLTADVIVSPTVGNTLSITPNGLYASGAVCTRTPWVLIGQADADTCDTILETDNIWHTGNVAIGANTIPANAKFYVSGVSVINNTTATTTNAIGLGFFAGTGGTIGTGITRTAIIANNGGSITSSGNNANIVMMANLGGGINSSSHIIVAATDTSGTSWQTYAAVIASEDSGLTGTTVYQGTHQVIIGSRDSNIISNATGASAHSGIYSSYDVGILNATRSVVIGSVEVDINGGGQRQVVIGALNVEMTSVGQNNVVIGGANHVVGSGAADGVILGGASNALNSTGGGAIIQSAASGINNGTGTIIAASGGTLNNSTRTIVTGDSNTASDQTNSFVGGRGVILSHAGSSFMWNNSVGGSFSSVAANQFRVNFIGGYFLGTNSTATTGMQLAAGGSAWTAISARETKKDFTEVDYDGIVNLVEHLNIYKGKYKDQPDSETHLYLIAEEWNSGLENGDIVSPKSILVQDEELGSKAMPAVNHMDIMSVSLAANKALIKENKDLKSKVEALNDRLERLEKLLV